MRRDRYQVVTGEGVSGKGQPWRGAPQLGASPPGCVTEVVPPQGELRGVGSRGAAVAETPQSPITH